MGFEPITCRAVIEVSLFYDTSFIYNQKNKKGNIRKRQTLLKGSCITTLPLFLRLRKKQDSNLCTEVSFLYDTFLFSVLIEINEVTSEKTTFAALT